MIYILDLPRPSSELINASIDYSKQTVINNDVLRFHESFVTDDVNCAYGEFSSTHEILNLVRNEYQKYFKKPINVVIGTLLNTKTDKLASYTPHSDRVRSIGINYYIELGGDNVQTVFYTKHREITDPGGVIVSYDGLVVDSQYKFDTDKWYAINSMQYHSVENLLTTRLMIGISILNTEFDELETITNNIQIVKV